MIKLYISLGYHRYSGESHQCFNFYEVKTHYNYYMGKLSTSTCDWVWKVECTYWHHSPESIVTF